MEKLSEKAGEKDSCGVTGRNNFLYTLETRKSGEKERAGKKRAGKGMDRKEWEKRMNRKEKREKKGMDRTEREKGMNMNDERRKMRT